MRRKTLAALLLAALWALAPPGAAPSAAPSAGETGPAPSGGEAAAPAKAGEPAVSLRDAPAAKADALKPHRALIHVHTTFSTGELTPAEIVEKAKALGISIVVFTDHDLVRVKWGPPPFRNLLSYGVDYRPSVLRVGVDTYFDTIEKLQQENPKMVIIPAVETAPFYYAEGDPIFGELTIHDWRRHILLLGMGREAVRNLPVLNNGLSTRYFSVLLPGTLYYLGAAVLALFLMLYPGWVRWLGAFVFLIGLVGAIDAHPFKSSPFSPYQGDAGPAPYQEIINYTEENGGFALWAHQGSLLAVQKVSHGKLETKPYTHLLLETVNYWAFDGLYEDNFTASHPGQEWDKYLVGYLGGLRPRPVWAYGGLDFHSERELRGKKRLDDIENIFYLDETSEDAFYRALVNGRFYVVRGYTKARLRMDRFEVSSPDGKVSGSYGTDLRFDGPPRVRFTVSTRDGTPVKVKAQLIRMGRVHKTFEGTTPLEVDFVDRAPMPLDKFYYRLDVKVNRSEHIITNPVFVRRPGAPRGGESPRP